MTKSTTSPTSSATTRIEQALMAAPTGLSLSDLRRAAHTRAADFFIALASLRLAGNIETAPDRRETPDGKVRGVLVYKWATNRSEAGSRAFQPGSQNAHQAAEAAWAAEAAFGDADRGCPGCGASVPSGWCGSCAPVAAWYP